jgi:hypothetical protein
LCFLAANNESKKIYANKNIIKIKIIIDAYASIIIFIFIIFLLSSKENLKII